MSVFQDKTLLITGGTGSFGNAVLRRFLRCPPSLPEQRHQGNPYLFAGREEAG